MCVLLQEIVDYWLNTAKYHQRCVFCYRRSLTIDWIQPNTTRDVCFVTGDRWLLIEYSQIPPEMCVLLQEIIAAGYRLNKAKYYQSFVICFLEITAVDYQPSSTTWIAPSTTGALCFVSGDRWLPTEQGQVLPELGALFSDGGSPAPAVLLAAPSHGAVHLLQVLAGPCREGHHEGELPRLFSPFSLCKMDVSLLDGAYVCAWKYVFTWMRACVVPCVYPEWVCVCVVPFFYCVNFMS